MKTILFGLCLSASICAGAQQIAKNLTTASNEFIGFYEYKPTDYNANPSTKYPLIIFLHGSGERGNGHSELPRVLTNAIPRYINMGHTMTFTWNGTTETFLVLSPQLTFNYGDWPNHFVREMIDYAKQNLRVDTNRIFLTGLSLGGGGAWSYPLQSVSDAQQLAAIAPVCGTCQWSGNFCAPGAAKLPIWAFHAADDPIVGVSCTNNTVQYIQNCNPLVQPIKTIWPTGNHWIWDRAYNTAYDWQNPNMYEWFLGQNKSLPVNVRPTANAGPNVTISTSSGTVNISGALSTDADGSLVRFVWNKISGPAFGTITTPVSSTGATTITGLTTAGTYLYELKAIDNRADWSFDTLTVTVINGPASNVPPVTEAGSDQVIAASATSLNGSASYDPDGVVTGYSWTKLSGPASYSISNASVANPTVSSLVIGTYKFVLEATDNVGDKSKDTVTIVETGALVPSTFLYFTGKKYGGVNELEWAIASEPDNDRFEIQRSSDGQQFNTIDIIKGIGVSGRIKVYSYTDKATSGDINYYRLKQIDKNGQFKYSAVVSIKNESKTTLAYFPNPVRRAITLSIEDKQTGNVHIRLLNLQGQLIKQKNISKQQQLITTAMNVEDITTGIYLLEVQIGNNLKEIRKIIKQ